MLGHGCKQGIEFLHSFTMRLLDHRSNLLALRKQEVGRCFVEAGTQQLVVQFTLWGGGFRAPHEGPNAGVSHVTMVEACSPDNYAGRPVSAQTCSKMQAAKTTHVGHRYIYIYIHIVHQYRLVARSVRDTCVLCV